MMVKCFSVSKAETFEEIISDIREIQVRMHNKHTGKAATGNGEFTGDGVLVWLGKSIGLPEGVDVEHLYIDINWYP